ncbi:rod shape-determining protein MreC [Hathewaya proteolytica DSM 3090]|uniref:Cell shape-determining protein MreC n=1 Tax=Hathewaya proteolytica DSM 3090 TaxID=1121331 RepID=A0A1M6JKL2_9CLOT|nr:rod shape-determining protein MreC [Hathewaya proteolytica]SHJ47204.1 rod shape-determining protein MreC [Hathewaya proteolytica DSM 3090]
MKFIKKHKFIIIIVGLCAGFFGLLIYSSKSNSINSVQNGVGVVLNPIQKFFYSVNTKVKNFGEFVFSFSNVKEENERLKKENNQLKKSLTDYNNAKKENSELRKLLNYAESNSEYKYICSDIVGMGGESYVDGYTINKGSKDGIKKRMIAVTDEGLVGQVVSVGRNWSIIQTLGNENICVAAFNERSNETNGIVKGYRENDEPVTTMETSNLDSDILKGDKIITSGLGGIYPKGISIGQVTEVVEDKSSFIKYGVIKPSVDMSKLEKVLIVVPNDLREVKY